jgi:serine/threonine protein phosphatase PrpC
MVVGTETKRVMKFETRDHKPTEPSEIERINASGGEVRSQTYPDGWTVHRIFVKGQDFPGLCMARTLGDCSVKDYGVIATPEVCEVTLDLEEKPFMILASDGVWEFLDSEFVIKAVAKKIESDGPERTLQKLQREAKKRWRMEEGDYCDDITSVLIQLRP